VAEISNPPAPQAKCPLCPTSAQNARGLDLADVSVPKKLGMKALALFFVVIFAHLSPGPSGPICPGRVKETDRNGTPLLEKMGGVHTYEHPVHKGWQKRVDKC